MDSPTGRLSSWSQEALDPETDPWHMFDLMDTQKPSLPVPVQLRPGNGHEYIPISTRDSDVFDFAGQTDDSALEEEQGPISELELLRQNVKLIFDDPSSSHTALLVHYAIIFFILSSVACAIVQTVPSMAGHILFLVSEPIFTVVFSVEVTIRCWVCSSYKDFFTNPFNIVDILATLPGYTDLLMWPIVRYQKGEEQEIEDLGDSVQTLRLAEFTRVVRLLRILRVANTLRQSEMITVVLKSVWGSLNGLWILMAFVVVSTVIAATVSYCVERVDPNSDFVSIPAAIWWAASTIMAVGYGDIVPKTVLGKIVAMATMFVGSIIMAVCIAVITNSFTMLYQRHQYALQVQRIQRQALRRSTVQSSTPPLSGVRHSGATGVCSTLVNDVADNPELPSDVQEQDFGAMVNKLEEMTEALLMEFNSLGLEGKAGTQSTLTLEILRQSSKLWFQQVRRFSEDILVSQQTQCGQESRSQSRTQSKDIRSQSKDIRGKRKDINDDIALSSVVDQSPGQPLIQ